MKLLTSFRRTTACIGIAMMLMPASADAKSRRDLGKPFGFCTRSSRTSSAESSAYSMTGGGTYTYPVPEGIGRTITLTSSGNDMKNTISNAVKNYSVVILDGSAGDFILSGKIGFSNISGKTIIGINGARLCTQWYTTEEIINALNEAGVPSMSTASGTGGNLSNGSSVSEEAEYNTRQIIIDITGDSNEKYRNAGVFSFSKCSNIIIRNIKFVGPGSIDVGGADLLSFTGSNNVWVDHCDFTDGQDGNFDITNSSNYFTVSWCTFSYTARSYMHQNTNLIGSSDSEAEGYLNTTFANNRWGENCRARMPMARAGKIHMLNNYYTCTGNATACINPRKNSEFLIEGNYFDSGITNAYAQSGAKAYTWTATNYAPSAYIMPDAGTAVTVPYAYHEMNTQRVPAEVGRHAGATLTTAEDWSEMRGDVNDDGEVTMADANLIVNAYLTGSDIDTATADMNGDNAVSMADANAIVNVFLAGGSEEDAVQ